MIKILHQTGLTAFPGIEFRGVLRTPEKGEVTTVTNEPTVDPVVFTVLTKIPAMITVLDGR
jgi:hypothetical protein